MSRAVSEVDIPDLAHRFQEWLPRIENGRVNEFMHLETIGFAPTSYSRMARFWGLEYHVYWSYEWASVYYYIITVYDEDGYIFWTEENSDLLAKGRTELDLSYRYVSVI